jgi:endonuclease/exonuclease/phosphatase family metal-dependent hydrolase
MPNAECRMTNVRRLRLAAKALVWLSVVLTTAVGRAELPAEIRVITYNIHHGRGVDGKLDLARIAKVLSAEKPDIVALQEVDQKTRRTGGVDQPAELARLTDMKVVFGRNIDFEGGGYGTAVLTKLPVRSSESIKLRSYYAPTKENPEQRGVQMIELGGKDKAELLFLCTHLDYRPADEERFNSALTINKFVKKRADMPAILAGDLNAMPESRVIGELRKEWRVVGWRTNTGSSQSADAAINDGWPMLTFPAQKPDRWIDYILYRPAARWRFVESRVLDEPVASDHRPVLAVLRRVP